MSSTFKSIITNPFVIGGTTLGVCGITAAVIYSKNRPKTDAEVALERDKEANLTQLKLKEMENKRAMDEFKEIEETKRQAKEQEERTKRLELEMERERQKAIENEKQRAWEKDMAINASPDYWQAQKAKNIAVEQSKLAEKELENRERIARIQADADKSAAEANAKAVREASYIDLRRQESTDRRETAKVQAITQGLASVINGRNS